MLQEPFKNDFAGYWWALTVSDTDCELPFTQGNSNASMVMEKAAEDMIVLTYCIELGLRSARIHTNQTRHIPARLVCGKEEKCLGC